MRNHLKDIYILGIGHSTPVFIDLAIDCGYNVAGLYHYNRDRNGELDHGYMILGSTEDLLKSTSLKGKSFILSMGDISIRESIYRQIKDLGGTLPILIHPSAVISRFSTINEGVCIGAFSHIQADTTIGENTLILSGVNISHTNKIGKNCFISGGATVGAYTIIEDNVFIGQAALTISSKVEIIGRGSYIGARSLVTNSVKAGSIAYGSPAKEHIK